MFQLNKKIEMDNSRLEKTIDMVHQGHLDDYQSMKGVNREFIKASKKFDQKLAIVVDLEKAYQNLLLHMKNTSQVVDSLIQLNVQSNTAKKSLFVDSPRKKDNSYSPPRAGSVSPEQARMTYNLNPMALRDQASEGLERTETQVYDEPSTPLERNATECLRLDSNKLAADFEGMNDYLQQHQKHH